MPNVSLADKRAKPYEILSAATLVLSVTSPYSQRYASAWKQIEDVARDPKNPASLDALVVLASEEGAAAHTSNRRQPIPFAREPSRTISNACLKEPPPPRLRRPRPRPPRPTVSAGDSVATAARSGGQSADTNRTPRLRQRLRHNRRDADSHSSRPSGTSAAGRTMSLKEVADALENHPDARPYHKLLALEVRARQDPALDGSICRRRSGAFWKRGEPGTTLPGNRRTCR